eukprot:2360067-Rhodomonas_salina.1
MALSTGIQPRCTTSLSSGQRVAQAYLIGFLSASTITYARTSSPTLTLPATHDQLRSYNITCARIT